MMRSLLLFAGRRFWIGLLILLMIGCAPAYATTDTTVTDCSYSSLQAALASGATTITFDCGSTSNTITVPEIDITGTVTLDATGQTVTLSGNKKNRIFYVAPGANLTLIHLIVQNGNADNGGGIWNDYGGTVTLTNSTVYANSATNHGGGIYNYDGMVTLTNSTVAANSAANSGGGISNDFGGTVTLTSSTVYDNTITGGGGGIWNDGTATLTNSTVAANSAVVGGGVYIYNGGTATLTNSTVYANSASRVGGGIFISSGSLNLNNSIIANSPSGDDCYNVDGNITQSGPNLVSDDSCAATDQRGAARPQDGIATCDLGSYEAGPTDTKRQSSPSTSRLLMVKTGGM